MKNTVARHSLRRVIAITLLAGVVPFTTTACFGSFPTLRKVYRWNANVHADKWVRWLVFVGINVIPVYFGAAIFDAVFSNSVEFWTGSNPMAFAPGTRRVVEGPDGERAVLVLREDRSIDVVISAPGKPDAHFVLVKETESIAAYDASGQLLARAGDGPDGQPALLAELTR